jgi:hypothetical protein
MGPADSAHRPALRGLESSIDPKILSKNRPEKDGLSKPNSSASGGGNRLTATANVLSVLPDSLTSNGQVSEETWRTR